MPFRPEYPGERPTLGWHVLEWVAEYLIVPDGATDGEPLVFTREQAEFVLKLYEVDRRFDGPAIRGRTLTNGRLIRRAVLSRPKGWGKSPLVGALCLVEALGPVVLEGWDANGRPVGVPWISLGFKPKVQIVAVSEDQTVNTWEPTLDMARRGPVYDNFDIEPMDTFINVPRGIVEAVTSSGTSREGFRPVFSACDQTESWTKSNGGRKLIATIRRNLGKVQGCSVETPNAFEPGDPETASVAQRSFNAYQLQKEGRTKKETGLLFDHREAPPQTDPEDEDSLREGLAYAYGDSADVNGGWVNLDRVIGEYWDPDTDPNDGRRYYLNQITNATDAWVTQIEWRACLYEYLEDFDPLEDGDVITLGFDGSQGRKKGKADATALIGCRVWDGHLFTIRVWEQPDGRAGRKWTVPVDEVDAEVRDAFKKYKVVGFLADPSGWTSNVATWEAKYGRRLRVRSTQQAPIAAWPRQKDSRVVEYVKRLHDAIVNIECSHDGSGALTRHVLNARRRETRQGYLLYKAFPDSPDKIDAAYAAVLAWRARLLAVSKGIGKKRPAKTAKARVTVLRD